MKIFSAIYQRVLQWSEHRHAPYYLAGVSFAESSFFPVPPDVMLMSMSLAKPHKAWQYALLTTVMSVLGALLGYAIGAFMMQAVTPVLHYVGYYQAFVEAKQWFHDYGFWVIFIAGFSPIPYKIFTIAAGAVYLALLPFIVASLIGRGCRFFLVAGLMTLFGDRIKRSLHRYIDRLGWALLIIIIAIIIFYELIAGHL